MTLAYNGKCNDGKTEATSLEKLAMNSDYYMFTEDLVGKVPLKTPNLKCGTYYNDGNECGEAVVEEEEEEEPLTEEEAAPTEPPVDLSALPEVAQNLVFDNGENFGFIGFLSWKSLPRVMEADEKVALENGLTSVIAEALEIPTDDVSNLEIVKVGQRRMEEEAEARFLEDSEYELPMSPNARPEYEVYFTVFTAIPEGEDVVEWVENLYAKSAEFIGMERVAIQNTLNDILRAADHDGTIQCTAASMELEVPIDGTEHWELFGLSKDPCDPTDENAPCFLDDEAYETGIGIGAPAGALRAGWLVAGVVGLIGGMMVV
jgi:hypothetical protein